MPDYATLKLCHVALAVLSGALFVGCGSASLLRASWRPSGAMRIVPYAVDTLLLTVGVLLALQLGSAATKGWLGAKLAAIVVYVTLGMLAMSRRRATPVRAAAFASACLVFGFEASIALTRSPAGFLSTLYCVFTQWTRSRTACDGPPIEARDDAKTGCLRQERNKEWRPSARVPFGLLPESPGALLQVLAGYPTRLRRSPRARRFWSSNAVAPKA